VPILLYRVDERLIHGQVVLGWGSRLRPARYLVVDDEVAASEWEQDLYRLALPDGVEALFVPVEAARGQLPEWQMAATPSVLLTRGVEAMHALALGGLLRGEPVNLGGVHHGPERERVLPFLHLSPEERRLVEAMAGEGVEVTAQDLPSSARIPLADLLE
jgi:mannose/fructose/N-acetylgalactosamine-specific phosphotransferase system component IIB